MNQLDSLKAYLIAHQSEIKQQYHIKQIGIFGSYVRGEATQDSDLDILVEFEPGYRFGLLTF